MEVSSLIDSRKYTVRRVPIHEKISFFVNSYINEINYEGDAEDLIRKMKWSNDQRKVLVICSR